MKEDQTAFPRHAKKARNRLFANGLLMHWVILGGTARDPMKGGAPLDAGQEVRSSHIMRHHILAAVFFSIFALAPMVAQASDGATQSDQVPILVQIFGCKQDPGIVPTVNVDFTDIHVKPDSASDKPFVFKLSIEPGLHRFFLSTPTCATLFHTLILKGHPREIPVRLLHYVLLAEEHTGCALAGVLPLDGLTLSLLLAKGSQYDDLTVRVHLTSPEDVSIPAVIDHSAYYVDDLFPGDYNLEIGFKGGSVEIPMHLSTTNGPKCQAFERDIGLQDLERPIAP